MLFFVVCCCTIEYMYSLLKDELQLCRTLGAEDTIKGGFVGAETRGSGLVQGLGVVLSPSAIGR